MFSKQVESRQMAHGNTFNAWKSVKNCQRIE